MVAVKRRLLTFQQELSCWSWRKFDNAEEQLKKKTKQLEELQRREGPTLAKAISKLQSEIDGILEQKDIKWKQRAKQNWYRDRDRNTQYFHAWANHHNKINGIQKICDDNERAWTKKEIIRAFIGYYDNLSTSQGPDGVDRWRTVCAIWRDESRET